MIKRVSQVKVCNIEACKFCAPVGQDTIDDNFNQFQGISVGARVARVADAITHDGDARAVRVLILGANLAYD